MADKHNEQTNSFCLEYQRLIKFGTILLQKIHTGDTNINISLWATDSIDYILSVMPIDIPEYKKLEELKCLYQKTYLIIPSSVSSDISYIIGNLNIAKNVFYCGARGDAKDVPPKNYSDIEYEEIKHTKEYVESNIIKELIGKEDGRTKNTAMLHTYGRLCHWVYSITKLNKPEDFLAISACARGMLEVFIDLNLFFHDLNFNLKCNTHNSLSNNVLPPRKFVRAPRQPNCPDPPAETAPIWLSAQTIFLSIFTQFQSF